MCFAEKQEAVTVRYTELTLLSADCIYEHIKTFVHIPISLQTHNLSIFHLQNFSPGSGAQPDFYSIVICYPFSGGKEGGV